MSWSSDSNPHTRNISRTSAAFGPMWRFTNRSVHANGRVFAAAFSETPFVWASLRVRSAVKIISAIKKGRRYGANAARQEEDVAAKKYASSNGLTHTVLVLWSSLGSIPPKENPRDIMKTFA